MATISKKSLLTHPQLIFVFIGALLIGSCNNQPPVKDQVCISVPVDTSELGRKNHFIPLMSIDIFEKDFKATRDSLKRAFPDLYIPNSETFNKASIVEFFKLPQVVGLKFYYGIKPGPEKRKALRLMIVGVDSTGKDVFIKGRGNALTAQGGSDDGGLEYGQCNPPCDTFDPNEN